MSFGATLTLSVNSVNKVLNRINQDSYGSEYYLAGSTESYRAFIRHTKEKLLTNGTQLVRHNVEIQHTVYGVKPAPDIVRYQSVVIRVPYNDDITLAGYFVTAVDTYIRNSTVESDLLNWLN